MFERATRLRRIRLPQLTRPATGGLASQDLPKVGLLERLYANISATTAGTITTQNSYGIGAIVNYFRLAINSGLDLVNITGPGYQYLLRDFIDLFADAVPQSAGRNAFVTATTYNSDMVLPIALNNRDQTGLVLLQNEQTLTSVYLNFESDANMVLTGGGTISAATCNITMEYLEIPNDPKDMPDLTTVHTLREDKVVVAGAGDTTYVVPRGNIYCGLYHLVGAANGVGAPTTWSRAILRAQQGNNIYDHDVNAERLVYSSDHISRDASLSGTAITGFANRVSWDFLGTDGLGAYGSVRDFLDTSKLTDLGSVITMAGAGELRSMRRELIPLKA